MKGVIGGLYRDRVHLDTSACGGLCDLVDEQPICRKGAWQAGFIFNTSIDAYNCADVTCADVEPFCGEASEIGLRARMMCPSTCRCDEPRSPLALSLPTSGCPAGCKRTVRYKVEMAQLPCEDVDKSDANFVSFLDEWKAAETTWPQDWREGSEGFISFFKQEGCSYLAATTPPAGLSPLRSLPASAQKPTCASRTVPTFRSRQCRFSARSRAAVIRGTTTVPTAARRGNRLGKAT